MKRVLICVMLLMISAYAYADVQEFRYFSIDVPEGWTAEEKENSVTIIADDKSASLTIIAGDPGGNTITELALLSSKELGGTSPTSDDEGNYSFEFGGGNGQATIAGDDEFYMLIVGTGFDENGEILSGILDSLEMK